MKEINLLIVACLFAVVVRGQQNNPFHLTHNHLALSVKDVDRSIEFYKRVLQLEEITNRTAMSGIRWLQLGEGKELHLIATVKEDVKINKAVHLGLSTTDFDGFVARLRELKIDFSDWPGKPNAINQRADGVKQIYFQDLDGYWIEVNNGYGAVIAPGK